MEERGGGGEAEKEENWGGKLRRGVVVGKRCGPTTPSSWTLFSLSPPHRRAHTIITQHQHHPAFITLTNTAPQTSTAIDHSTVSARKLGAALWDLLPFAKMHRGAHPVNGAASANGAPPARSRHVDNTHSHSHHHILHRGGGQHKDKGVVDLSQFLADTNSLTSDPDQPASASSLRRHLVASLMQHHHHRTAERNTNSHTALQPVSPASYGSSMEVAAYNPAVTPTSSLDFRGRVGEPHHHHHHNHHQYSNLKTSTELIKVLNRIWSLEEQHASNMSLIKALKTELDHSRAKTKELLRERQSDRREIDDLVKQVTEDKLVRKSKEQSVREELEDERRLRKRSESLHRKLARDLSAAKASLSAAVKELERERASRKLLEDLCDEFANGIRDYEQEVHCLRQKLGSSDRTGRNDRDRDRLILHVSESWLDERMQMKIEEEGRGEEEGKDSIVDKLRLEIETFLLAKTHKPLARERRNSLESVPLNDDGGDEDDDDGDSLGSESNCFELQKPSDPEFKLLVDDGDETVKSSDDKTKKLELGERVKGRTPSSLQVKFEEKMARAVKTEEGQKQPPPPSETSQERRCEITTGAVDSGGNNFGWRDRPSPVRPWMARLNSPDLDVPESSSKHPSGSRDNTLKAKLLEARSKSRRPRPKASKPSC